MVTGRKRIASAIHRANGSYKHNPQRENKNEPIPVEGVPAKPEYVLLNKDASGYWDHAIAVLADLKILSRADKSILETFALAMAFKKQAAIDHDLKAWTMANKEAMRCMSELGLTPSARTRLSVKDVEQEDAFTQWQKGFLGND